MENMETIEVISCQIIAASGCAKSNYVEAIELAKKGKIDEALDLIEQSKEIFLQGHEAYAKLLALSAQDKLEIPLLLMHAEDQMMNCETMKIMALELIEQCRQFQKIDQRLGRIESAYAVS